MVSSIPYVVNIHGRFTTTTTTTPHYSIYAPDRGPENNAEMEGIGKFHSLDGREERDSNDKCQCRNGQGPPET